MTAIEFTSLLEGVRTRGVGKWSARCPAHDDKSPSLSVMQADKGILVHCFAGCSLTDITQKLGMQVKELFFDGLSTNAQQRREAMERRERERTARQKAREAEGRRLDTLREAEHLVRSASGISVDTWTDHALHTALNRLGDAYALLEGEERHGRHNI